MAIARYFFSLAIAIAFLNTPVDPSARSSGTSENGPSGKSTMSQRGSSSSPARRTASSSCSSESVQSSHKSSNQRTSQLSGGNSLSRKSTGQLQPQISKEKGKAVASQISGAAKLPPKTSNEESKTTALRKSQSEKSLDVSTSGRSINHVPDEVVMEIFKKTPFPRLRKAVPGMDRRLKSMAYSKELHPTVLKLIYDVEHPDKKCSHILDPKQRIDFDVFKTLEISVKGDANRHGELYKFSDRKDIILSELEYLKIDMEWTNSYGILIAFSKLLKKTRKLKGFSLKLNDIFLPIISHCSKRSQHEKFWDAVRNAKPKDVEFVVGKKGDRQVQDTMHLTNVHFMMYVFTSKHAFLKNLRTLTVEWNSFEGICEFIAKSVTLSYRTIREINIDFECLIYWMYEDVENYRLEENLSNCQNLEKLFVSFPVTERSVRNRENYGAETWTALTRVVSARKNIYLGLTANTNYLYFEGILEALSANLENKLPTKYLKLTVNPSQRDYKSEVATVLRVCPTLETLEIDSFVADTNSIRYFLERAKKLKKLKELAVSYQQPEAALSSIYEELSNLAQFSSGITKVTVKVASSTYQRFLSSAEESETELNQDLIKDSHRKNVKLHLLSDSDKIKLENLLGGSFEVESKLATTSYEHDSHLLILRKNA